ncbi:cation:proton antiporter regulatory subunit [Desulfosporosinus meridiei]|uniref:Putative regulatory ligand binding protein, C-terminal domain of K+ channels like protein n=1 Tax=Desulfosporosinus meridiei (strain ATCC BAA-275 / DSM 13257 / KCTC 12902 / NCIMB 13706 / S10) TaxID=768704 RepID=J7ILE3_DESMD|nr:cation:proton antiporter regulatory subunit [Desulfosporosinus meridiei]AFQ42355.1 putative regulatory ligand binding protein, C-terminal domain of K+ channels like protein [Desulfosporosinus meridiei DSM 13257]
MKQIKETNLPGIGKKFQLIARSGEKIVIVVHDDGRREIYHFYREDPDDSISMVTLDDEESRCIAAILGGMTYRPKALETVDIALGDMVIEWHKIEPDAYAIGKTIKDLCVRQVTGGTIIAIVDHDQNKTVNPGPEASFRDGSTVVIIGDKNQVKACKHLLLHGSVK